MVLRKESGITHAHEDTRTFRTQKQAADPNLNLF
jgi:hypothetical protein